MRQNLAVLIDGVLHLPSGECTRTDHASSTAVAKIDNRAVDEPMHEVDQIVEHLSCVVVLAQKLSEQDMRRAREFARVTHAVLTGTTCLPKSDQQLFQDAIRDAARRI